MKADYSSAIRCNQTILKTPPIPFFIIILSFVTLKPEEFPVAGHAPDHDNKSMGW